MRGTSSSEKPEISTRLWKRRLVSGCSQCSTGSSHLRWTSSKARARPVSCQAKASCQSQPVRRSVMVVRRLVQTARLRSGDTLGEREEPRA